MTRDCDVLIIGAGAAGCSAAYHLQQAGRQVVLLDQGRLGGGCSEKNAGLIVPSHVVPLAAPGVMSQGLKWMLDATSPFYIRPRLDWELLRWIWAFRAAANERRMRAALPVLHQLLQVSLAGLEQLDQLLDCGLSRRGMLITYSGDKGRKDSASTATLARSVGQTVEDLDEQALRRLEPHVHSAARGGIFFPQDAHLDPAILVRRLAESAVRRGADLLLQTKVLGARREGAALTVVQTSAGEFRPREIVLCGGAWSPNLLPGVRLPVQAGKGYSVTLPARGRIPVIPQILAEAKVSVTPLGEQIRFSGTLELGGLDGSINRRRADSILRQAADYLSDFSPADVRDADIWSGFRPCSPDGLPLIGRYPGLDNLIVATGFAMIGISLAPIAGTLVTELAQRQKTTVDLTPLSPARFL